MENHPDCRRRGKRLVLAIAVLAGSSVALLWGWNTFAGEVLSQPPIQFRHAVGLQLLLLSVAGTFPIARRLFGVRSR